MRLAGAAACGSYAPARGASSCGSGARQTGRPSQRMACPSRRVAWPAGTRSGGGDERKFGCPVRALWTSLGDINNNSAQQLTVITPSMPLRQRNSTFVIYKIDGITSSSSRSLTGRKAVRLPRSTRTFLAGRRRRAGSVTGGELAMPRPARRAVQAGVPPASNLVCTFGKVSRSGSVGISDRRTTP